jgi:hypothetical protein
MFGEDTLSKPIRCQVLKTTPVERVELWEYADGNSEVHTQVLGENGQVVSQSTLVLTPEGTHEFLKDIGLLPPPDLLQ